jgi:uracil-DNA glycosylase family 4
MPGLGYLFLCIGRITLPAQYGLHCESCQYLNATHLPLATQMVRAMPLSMEDNHAPVLLIFQAPGVYEWAEGRPVISNNPSSAGVRLEAAFQLAHRARNHYNITNAVQCFPGKMPQHDLANSRDKAPPVAVTRLCAEWLRQDIEAYQYERIIVFGSKARKTVRALGYGEDIRFHFCKHPTGGISNVHLAEMVAY